MHVGEKEKWKRGCAETDGHDESRSVGAKRNLDPSKRGDRSGRERGIAAGQSRAFGEMPHSLHFRWSCAPVKLLTHRRLTQTAGRGYHIGDGREPGQANKGRRRSRRGILFEANMPVGCLVVSIVIFVHRMNHAV
jgi:hypothetical protein